MKIRAFQTQESNWKILWTDISRKLIDESFRFLHLDRDPGKDQTETPFSMEFVRYIQTSLNKWGTPKEASILSDKFGGIENS